MGIGKNRDERNIIMEGISRTPSPVRRRAIAAALCALLTTAPLAGCGKQAEEAQVPGEYAVKAYAMSTDGIECSDAAFVVTAAQGQAFRVPESALAYAKAAVENGGYVSTVDASGNVNGRVFEAKSNSKSNQREEVDANTKAVFKSICNVRATEPEIDLLAALNAAAGDLQAHGGNNKVVCVVSSGISTRGLLATTPQLLAADPQDIAAQLSGLNSIGDYSGINVRFYGPGQTTGEQMMPASAAGKNAALLVAVVEKGGGTVTMAQDILTPLGCDDQLAECSIMAFGDGDTLTLPTVSAGQTAEITLSNSQLQFVGDEATFADPDASARLLDSIASQCLEHKYASIQVEGHTAASQLYDSDAAIALSTRRAKAVASELISRGMDEQRISASGVGDRDSTSLATGNFDEEAAKQDRKVIIRIQG